jgi:hypothetical protein
VAVKVNRVVTRVDLLSQRAKLAERVSVGRAVIGDRYSRVFDAELADCAIVEQLFFRQRRAFSP